VPEPTAASNAPEPEEAQEGSDSSETVDQEMIMKLLADVDLSD
jgi:hypothetical protein